MIRYRRRHRAHPDTDMNITAFMNLMVILVPFLLITAVFSRVTILELNFPPAASAAPDPKQELRLEITIRRDALEIGERARGVLKRLPKGGQGHDIKALSQILIGIKQRFPDKLDAAILSEPDTSYDDIVQVMDAVRLAEIVQGGQLTRVELFPEISIGDAPTRGAAAPYSAERRS